MCLVHVGSSHHLDQSQHGNLGGDTSPDNEFKGHIVTRQAYSTRASTSRRVIRHTQSTLLMCLRPQGHVVTRRCVIPDPALGRWTTLRPPPPPPDARDTSAATSAAAASRAGAAPAEVIAAAAAAAAAVKAAPTRWGGAG